VIRPYYQDASTTLYHGDARDILPELGLAFDLVLADPPYGQQFAGQGVKTQNANIRADGARQGVRVARQVLFEISQLTKPDAHVLVFCHWESWPDFYDALCPLFPIKNALIWWKARGGMGDTDMEYARDYEVILYGASGRRALTGRRDGAVIRGFPPVGSDRIHPTEKPENLLRWLIGKHCPPGGAVLDPFVGCGSTLVATKAFGCTGVGIEIEERWCEATARRLSQEVRPLVTPPPPHFRKRSPVAVSGRWRGLRETPAWPTRSRSIATCAAASAMPGKLFARSTAASARRDGRAGTAGGSPRKSWTSAPPASPSGPGR
jgi:site-specific DNA-methyltransferase (adenine-specific)